MRIGLTRRFATAGQGTSEVFIYLRRIPICLPGGTKDLEVSWPRRDQHFPLRHPSLWKEQLVPYKLSLCNLCPLFKHLFSNLFGLKPYGGFISYDLPVSVLIAEVSKLHSPHAAALNFSDAVLGWKT